MSYCNSYYENSLLYYIDENKLFSYLTTFTFAIVGIFLYILRCYTFFEKRNIPRAVRPTAPFGNIKEVLFRDTNLYIFLWKYYNRFKRKGYKFAGLYLFLKPAVLIVNPILMYKVLSNEQEFRNLYRKNSIKDSKKIIGFFNDGLLEVLLKDSSDIKERLLMDLRDKCPISTGLHNFIVDTTCLTLGLEKNQEISSFINRFVVEKASSSFTHYFHLVYPYFKTDKLTGELKRLTENICSKNINDKNTKKWFFDLLNESNSESEEIVSELFDIFIENLIHSHSATLFCLYELASNVEIQQELLEEIRRFNTENKTLNLDNLHHLIYLEAVVKETFRKYPPVPLVLKQCTNDYKNNDFLLNLPKGCFLFATIFGLHHDPANYSDPETFDPDRFFEDNLKYIKPNTYIPFGLDWRKQIGFRFTTVHVKLAIFSLLSSFKVILTDEDHCLAFDNKLTVFPKEPLPLQLEALK